MDFQDKVDSWLQTCPDSNQEIEEDFEQIPENSPTKMAPKLKKKGFGARKSCSKPGILLASIPHTSNLVPQVLPVNSQNNNSRPSKATHKDSQKKLRQARKSCSKPSGSSRPVKVDEEGSLSRKTSPERLLQNSQITHSLLSNQNDSGVHDFDKDIQSLSVQFGSLSSPSRSTHPEMSPRSDQGNISPGKNPEKQQETSGDSVPPSLPSTTGIKALSRRNSSKRKSRSGAPPSKTPKSRSERPKRARKRTSSRKEMRGIKKKRASTPDSSLSSSFLSSSDDYEEILYLENGRLHMHVWRKNSSRDQNQKQGITLNNHRYGHLVICDTSLASNSSPEAGIAPEAVPGTSGTSKHTRQGREADEGFHEDDSSD